MTNEELVKRLREHAENCRTLDMLEGRPALADEAASAIEDLQRQLAEKDEGLREAVEALKPFAKLAGLYDPVEDDDADKCWCVEASPTLGNLRAARAALAGDKQ